MLEFSLAMPLPEQQSIRDAIAREESRLLRLEGELTEAQARLAALKTALGTPRESVEASSSTPLTAVEKVVLFRSRFRAARRFIQDSGRTPGRDARATRRPVGTSGSVACARSPG